MSEGSSSLPRTVGRYRLVDKLGEGGMGVVYRAEDERLKRPVALKMLRREAADTQARSRLWREARAAASLSHPNVCQLYEIAEEDGELFLTMELLDGESLWARLRRGPMPCEEAVRTALAILSALGALHERGLVHRDLKPSNVFLTPHGVKLLDFGLASAVPMAGAETETRVTMAGTLIGTPTYMAPEQVTGHPVDARADIFAMGCVLFEMLSGKAPFARDTTVQELHAITHEQPPMLGGSPAIVAIGQAVQRSLAKSPADRFVSAPEMAGALTDGLSLVRSGEVASARAMSRLMVLPFRLLRGDPSIDFLAYSLPDAITSSLSGLDSLIVSSSLVSARFAGDVPDWNAIAREARVDIVLTGALLQLDERIRVTTQMIEVPGGSIMWSHTTDVSHRDLFQVQDDLASRIVESLALPLTARDRRLLKHDVPSNAKAYEFYLRGNQVAQTDWPVARDLYLQSVQDDPQYAPAWARLGRMYRLLGKFGGGSGEEEFALAQGAFDRALSLNDELSLAHNQYARLEIDFGRAESAMLRLLQQLRSRRQDPELFAALVQACRYCGLLDASSAAHDHAYRLDPLTPTSVAHTYVMLGLYQQALNSNAVDPLTRIVVLLALGRRQEAAAIVLELEREADAGGAATIGRWARALHSLVENRREEAIARTLSSLPPTYRDPETLYYTGRQLAYLGERQSAMTYLTRAVNEGFTCFEATARDAWFDALRGDPSFEALVERAKRRSDEARAAFVRAGGPQLLGCQ